MKKYEEVMLSNEELSELLLLGKESKTIENAEVTSGLCYLRIMNIDRLTFPSLGDHHIYELELLADMVARLRVNTLNLEDIMINKSHQKVLRNIVKSESLHTLYIKFNNMRLGTELSACELANSKSLTKVYIGFSGIFNHSKIYGKIIEPITEIPKLQSLIFKFSNNYEARYFISAYKSETDSMIEKRNEDAQGKLYDCFTGLHYGEMQLQIDIVGVIAEKYINLSSLNVEYGLD